MCTPIPHLIHVHLRTCARSPLQKAGRFNAQQVSQQLSRLFHPPSVEAVLNPQPGMPPPMAPRCEDLTNFLDSVLLRMDMHLDVEEFMKEKVGAVFVRVQRSCGCHMGARMHALVVTAQGAGRVHEGEGGRGFCAHAEVMWVSHGCTRACFGGNSTGRWRRHA